MPRRVKMNMKRISRAAKNWISFKVIIILASNSLNDVHDLASLNTLRSLTARSDDIAPPPRPPSMNVLMTISTIEMMTTEPSKTLKLSLQ